jgi:hypothetical protein
MGDDRVREAAKKDASDLLAFFRETNQLQESKGYFQLEEYPLEAKLCLGWTGSITPMWGEYGLSNHPLSNDYMSKRLDITAYRWDAVNVTTLKKMREIVEEKGWLGRNVNQVAASLEYYFYFQGRRKFEDTWRSDHWIYCHEDMHDILIEIDGQKHKSWHLFTPNCQFDFYIRNGYVTGNCADETSFIGAWLKSWGIASTATWIHCDRSSHMYSIYYDPSDRTWKAYKDQLGWYVEESQALGVTLKLTVMQIFRPPVQQRGYLKRFTIPPDIFGGNMLISFEEGFTLDSIRNTFSEGLPTSQMKQWLLYS